MNKKKIFSITIALALAFAMIYGCDSTESTTTATTESTTTAATESTTSESETDATQEDDEGATTEAGENEEAQEQKSYSVSFIITDTEGLPLSDISAEAVANDDVFTSSVSDENGSIQMSDIPDSFTINLYDDEGLLASSDITIGVAEDYSVEEGTEGIDIYLPEGEESFAAELIVDGEELGCTSVSAVEEA